MSRLFKVLLQQSMIVNERPALKHPSAAGGGGSMAEAGSQSVEPERTCCTETWCE